MSGDEHDHTVLAGLVMGGLQPGERADAQAHVDGCEQCRRERDELAEMAQLLQELPPEALLEGPLPDGELLLQRTLRQARAESTRALWTRRIVTGAAVVLLAVGSVGVGLVAANQEHSQVADPPVTDPSGTPTAAPTVTVNGYNRDRSTLAIMRVKVTPADGWVRVQAEVSGIPEGQRCLLYVVARDGRRTLAGGWLVSAKGAKEGVILDGTALVDPKKVEAIEVETVGGKRYVEAQI